MIESIIQYLNWNVYPQVILILLAAWLMLQERRDMTLGILYSFNTLMLVIGLLQLLISSAVFWKYFQEIDMGAPSSIFLFGYCLRAIFLIGLFVKNARKSFAYSIVIALSTLVDSFVISVTHLHRDYIGSEEGISGLISSFRPFANFFTVNFWPAIISLTIASLLFFVFQRKQ